MPIMQDPYSNGVLPTEATSAPDLTAEVPVKTPAELAKEDKKFGNRVRNFAARFPYIGWALALIVAPYFLFLAWKESRKSDA